MFNLISNLVASKETETAGTIASTNTTTQNNASTCAYTGSFNCGSSSSASSSSFSAVA